MRAVPATDETFRLEDGSLTRLDGDLTPVQRGDLINTGTPPGIGLGFDPPVWLRPGDVMELGIEGLGRQRQNVIGPR